MLAPVGLQEIGEDHRVAFDPVEADSLPGQHDGVVLDVLADLFDGRVLQDPAQGLEGGLFGDLAGGIRVVVPERKVKSFIGLERERNSDQIGLRWIGTVGLGNSRFSRTVISGKSLRPSGTCEIPNSTTRLAGA